MTRFMHTVFIPALFIICLPLNAGGQEAQSPVRLSLQDAVEKALSSSSRLQAGSAELAAGEAARAQARTGRLPALDLELSYMRLNEREPATIELPPPPSGPGPVTLGEAPENTYSATLSLRQPLFTGGEINARIEAAEHSVQAGRSRWEWSRGGVVLDVRTAYWRLLEATQRVHALEERLRQVKENLANMERRLENGVVTRSKVLTVEMRLAEVRHKLLRAKNGLEMAGTRLALLTGLPADQPINPVTPLPDSGQALTLEKNRENDGSSKDATLPDPQELVREALKERGDLAEQRSTLRAAETAERTARSGWFPQLFLVGEYTYARPNPEVFPTENQFNSSWRLGIAGRIELGSMPRVYHRVARRGAEREAAAARLRQAEQQVRLAVREAYLEWKSSGEELALARTIVRRAEENLSETRTRVENGAALNEDLLEAQAVLLEARLSLTSAEIGRQIARDRLMRELGREL